MTVYHNTFLSKSRSIFKLFFSPCRILSFCRSLVIACAGLIQCDGSSKLLLPTLLSLSLFLSIIIIYNILMISFIVKLLDRWSCQMILKIQENVSCFFLCLHYVFLVRNNLSRKFTKKRENFLSHLLLLF